MPAQAARPPAASTASNRSLLGAPVNRADFIGADPGLLHQAAVAERQRALAGRRRRHRALADRKAGADPAADPPTPAPPDPADPETDRRAAAVRGRALGQPRVHLGAVGERSTTLRRAPCAHRLLVACANP